MDCSPVRHGESHQYSLQHPLSMQEKEPVALYAAWEMQALMHFDQQKRSHAAATAATYTPPQAVQRSTSLGTRGQLLCATVPAHRPRTALPHNQACVQSNVSPQASAPRFAGRPSNFMRSPSLNTTPPSVTDNARSAFYSSDASNDDGSMSLEGTLFNQDLLATEPCTARYSAACGTPRGFPRAASTPVHHHHGVEHCILRSHPGPQAAVLDDARAALREWAHELRDETSSGNMAPCPGNALRLRLKCATPTALHTYKEPPTSHTHTHTRLHTWLQKFKPKRIPKGGGGPPPKAPRKGAPASPATQDEACGNHYVV